MRKDDGKVGYWSKTTPAKKVSIRNMDSVSYKVIDLKRESTHDDGILETMEYSMAMLKLYLPREHICHKWSQDHD